MFFMLILFIANIAQMTITIYAEATKGIMTVFTAVNIYIVVIA